MSRSTDFASVIRGGTRAGSTTLVVHQRLDVRPGQQPPMVGLVVSRSVGGSVVRHRVSRRLRALLHSRLDALPQGSGTVVRALPASAVVSSAVLAADLDRTLARTVKHRGSERAAS